MGDYRRLVLAITRPATESPIPQLIYIILAPWSSGGSHPWRDPGRQTVGERRGTVLSNITLEGCLHVS